MNKPKILIVEDQLLIAKEISIILEKEGYETRIGITSVSEAISILTTEKFDLVLIDIKLSDSSDGIDLGKYLLTKDTLPFIYITAYSSNSTLIRINESRPHGIIVKPFKHIDIISSVSIVLNNYMHKNIDVYRNKDIVEDQIPFILKKSVDYINDNIYEKIEVTKLSELSKWSHQHFIRVFSKYIGKTPYQYILQKKIERSLILIRESDLKLDEIAFELNFNSYSNFVLAFKKQIGITPTLYRQKFEILSKIN